MAKKSDTRDDRKAAIAKAKAEQDRRERKRRLLTWGVVGVVIVGLVGGAGAIIVSAAQQKGTIEAAAASPIPGVTENLDQSTDHVTGLPEPTATAGGTLLPPSGGEHDPTWLNCGVYTDPVPTYNAVHSLEHGAVWVTYSPDLDPSEIADLRSDVAPYSYTILSPFNDLAAPIVLTAWGEQLEVQDTSDIRIQEFLAKYVLGSQAPEPGGECTGGVGQPS
ncbi:DUF3105 domain-containing protein [Demequina capsici]|uniref:DUF3105 domain-containing protein n=1 Tax=Demequina capsici TaxID=3075620 RepID=A0AA96F5A3_9MICO|nr:DUF3105 domain-containing protein [Demequina sp. OYTSA14]WNM23674.1 DUF3105 domain-containing protein [Demequina sp. OYTSA14]